MKPGRLIVLSLAAFVAAAVAADSFARGRGGHRGGGGHHHHGGGGARVFVYAAPAFYVPRYYYPAPAYYYPPPAPMTYIEQPQQGYWHYCPQSGAYFPQVQTCPGGWQLVPPQPRTGY